MTGDGKRVEKSGGKLYWYGLGGEVLAESDLAGNVTSEYIYFNGQMIARRDPGSSNVYYYLADRLGSARMMVSVAMNGTVNGVVSESDFYPYGGERVISNTLTPANNYKFTGHERDAESGLDHTLNRQYSSNTGRWLSPDPTSGSYGSPQSWNAYSYVKGDPIDFTDPDGLSPCGSSWHAYYNADGSLGGFSQKAAFANNPTIGSLITQTDDDAALMGRVVFAESDAGKYNPVDSLNWLKEKEAVALSIQNRVDILNGTIKIQGLALSTAGFGPVGATLRQVLDAPGQYRSINPLTGDINGAFWDSLNSGLGLDSLSTACENILTSYDQGYDAVNHLLTGAADPFAGAGVVTSFHQTTTPSRSETSFNAIGSSPNIFFGFGFVNGQPTARHSVQKPNPIPPGGPAQAM